MNTEVLHLVTEIRVGGGHVSLDADGKLVVKAPARLAALVRSHADDLRVVLREERYVAMTDADLRDEERRWVAEQERIAREERPFVEIVAELDAAERPAERGGRR